MTTPQDPAGRPARDSRRPARRRGGNAGATARTEAPRAPRADGSRTARGDAPRAARGETRTARGDAARAP
ncbi:DEAD/DEAH box helicase, partial [Streptomyces sp. NPDC058426]